MGRRQVVRHRFLVAAFAGSNPAVPTKVKDSFGGLFLFVLLTATPYWAVYPNLAPNAFATHQELSAENMNFLAGDVFT